MIDHDINSLNLVSSDEGEIVLPSEVGNIKFEGTLRQFIVLTRRAYSENALANLEDSEGLITESRSNEDQEDVAPYFGLTLRFKPQNTDLETFTEEYGDDFFNSLLTIVGQSDMRGVRGRRAAFVREFRAVHDGRLGKVLESKILVGTSVFFNDYRVTTGYPHDDRTRDAVAGRIYDQICSQWSNLRVELTVEALEEDDDEFDF